MDTRTDAWLDSIRIASPCEESWDAMTGDERSRFCERCEMSVYNLSGMTRTEAEDFVRNSNGRVCARFYRRADGTVMTADCPRGLARVRRRAALIAVGVVGLLIGAVGLVAAAVSGRKPVNRLNRTAGWSERLPKPFRTVLKPFDEPPRRVMMGEMVLAPTPPKPAPAPSPAPGGSGQ